MANHRYGILWIKEIVDFVIGNFQIIKVLQESSNVRIWLSSYNCHYFLF